MPVARQRDGIADALLLRTLATLPFLPEAGLDPAAKLLFQEPAPLLRLGYALTVQFSLPECQKINPEEYNQRMETMPTEIDWSRIMIYEHEDETTLSGQIACTGPGCDN